LRQSAALRESRQPGYRTQVWANLRQAAGLPGSKPDDIRREVLACLGDPIGLEPAGAASAPRAAPPEIPERLRGGGPKGRNARSAVAPDGKLLAAYEGTGNRVVLRGEDGEIVASAERPLGSVYDLKFTTDGRFLVAGCEEGVAVWAVPDLRLF